MENKEGYYQEGLLFPRTAGVLEGGSAWISGRKVRVRRDEDSWHGTFDLGFEEQVEVSFSNKEMAALLDLEAVSFLRKRNEITAAQWGEELKKAVPATIASTSTGHLVGCGRFYGYHEGAPEWYLSEDDKESLNALLESYWRRRSFQMEYLYRRKNAGFFFAYGGKSYFLPRGQRLTFYRYGIEKSGFHNVFGVVAPHLSGGIALSMASESMAKGLSDYLKEARKMHLLVGSMLQVITLYVWSFRRRGRRWFPFFKNKNLRLGVRLIYGHYLHSVLPAAERWQRVLSISKKGSIETQAVEKAFMGALKKCYMPLERYLDCCEELLRCSSNGSSLGQLRRLEKCLEGFLWVAEKRQMALQLMGPVEVRFEGVGDISKKFSNVVTRRPLASAGAEEGAPIPGLQGFVGGHKGKTIGEIMPAFDRRYLSKRLLVPSLAIEKKTTAAGKALGVDAITAAAIKRSLERKGAKGRALAKRRRESFISHKRRR